MRRSSQGFEYVHILVTQIQLYLDSIPKQLAHWADPHFSDMKYTI